MNAAQNGEGNSGQPFGIIRRRSRRTFLFLLISASSLLLHGQTAAAQECPDFYELYEIFELRRVGTVTTADGDDAPAEVQEQWQSSATLQATKEDFARLTGAREEVALCGDCCG